ncbi:MAG TPA: acylphosphatase [Myxococcota bacterium]|nr:acylphosphatase [Myxococcota bacterium]HRY93892.1 acylphosphatase [Myxococcota bacterium]HSA23581.1 acylphosphatase [Myxococcota bacterium]
METGRARLRLLVEGVVQGVGYRYHARREARALGLTGWVRNLPDGRVELLAEGPREALASLLAWSRRGPPAAEVAGVEPRWEPEAGEFSGFEVRP